MSYNEKVYEFYKAFKQEQHINDVPSLDIDRLLLKLDLISEEFSELVDACLGKNAGEAMREAWNEAKNLDDGTRDIVEAADATADLQYVIEGFNLETGIPSEAIFDIVHKSNMSKLADNGEPIFYDGTIEGKPAGKIAKSNNFFEPTPLIEEYLTKQQEK